TLLHVDLRQEVLGPIDLLEPAFPRGESCLLLLQLLQRRMAVGAPHPPTSPPGSGGDPSASRQPGWIREPSTPRTLQIDSRGSGRGVPISPARAQPTVPGDTTKPGPTFTDYAGGVAL